MKITSAALVHLRAPPHPPPRSLPPLSSTTMLGAFGATGNACGADAREDKDHRTEADPLAFDVVVAYERATGGIGVGGALPWHLPDDLRRFRRLTWGGAVVMGRRTWESLPGAGRGLAGRVNVVVSRSGLVVPPPPQPRPEGGAQQADPVPPPPLVVCASLEDALRAARQAAARVFVIGGEELYRHALEHPACGAVHATEVHYGDDGDGNGGGSAVPAFDRFFPLDVLRRRFTRQQQLPPALDASGPVGGAAGGRIDQGLVTWVRKSLPRQ
jgi:dihydrofolate reductase